MQKARMGEKTSAKRDCELKIEQFKLFRNEKGDEKLLNEEDWGFVYVFRTQYDDLYKIGFTNRNPEKRLKDMNGMNPHSTKIIIEAYVKYPKAVEKYLHERFKRFKAKKEWYRFLKIQVDEIKRIINYLAWMDRAPTE